MDGACSMGNEWGDIATGSAWLGLAWLGLAQVVVRAWRFSDERDDEKIDETRNLFPFSLEQFGGIHYFISVA